MADISGYIREIEVASRGEQVRDSIVGALTGMNDDLPALAHDALAGRIWRGVMSLTSSWRGSDPYYQSVNIEDISADALIDLTPDVTAYTALSNAGVKAIWAENNNGSVTVRCIGAKPSSVIQMPFLVFETGAVVPESESSGAEMTSNKVTAINSQSTDKNYPSAKAVYRLFSSIVNGNEVSY
ncbi:MAG: hypothetical protein IJH62_07215 [Mogibacterium sp.]|nr:hypothetical protein [Mogibacterium sp.]